MVLNTPKLWSTFEIEVTGSTRDLTSAQAQDVTIVDTMDRWLRRSKNCPLTVKMIHAPLSRVAHQRSGQLIAALASHAHRWRSVHLSLHASDVDTLYGALLSVHFPQLQALIVRLNGSLNSSLSLDISSLDLPWHQLAVLDLQMQPNNISNLDKCLEILAQAANLERFTVNVECALLQPENFMERINLPKLHTLDLVLHSGGSGSWTPFSNSPRPEAQLTAFLTRLSLPQLRDLRLAWFVRNTPPAWSVSHNNFVAFLHGVAQTVDVLSMRYLPLTQDELAECVGVLAGIRELDLRFPLSDALTDPITDEFFARCTEGAGSSRPVPAAAGSGGTSGDAKQRVHGRVKAMLLPRLQRLNVHCCGSRYTPETLVAFIEARFRGSSGTLTAFHVLSMTPVLSSMERRLARYRADGLDVSLDTLLVR